MGGWVRLHRGWENSSKFKPEPYCERAAWCWLLSNAAWKESRRIGGKGDEVVIGEGQIHVSDRSLASVWGWEKKRVRRFLTKLETTKSATINRTSNGTVLTLENWELYQSREPSSAPSTTPIEDQPRTTHKEGKEEKKVSAKPKKHSIPSDWQPSDFGDGTESQKIVAGWHKEFFKQQVESFKAHHTAKGSQFVNWQSAWSTWVIGSRRFSNVNDRQDVVVGI